VIGRHKLAVMHATEDRDKVVHLGWASQRENIHLRVVISFGVLHWLVNPETTVAGNVVLFHDHRLTVEVEICTSFITSVSISPVPSSLVNSLAFILLSIESLIFFVALDILASSNTISLN